VELGKYGSWRDVRLHVSIVGLVHVPLCDSSWHEGDDHGSMTHGVTG
jgi:hypothetical protein